MKLKTITTVVFSALLIFSASVKAQTITQLNQPSSASIRGLSVLDDKVAWLSGSKANFAITTDGGKNWAWHQVKGYEKLDFRDIEAFSAKEAIIMSSGTPAVILKTIDGGETWQEKYHKDDQIYFLDAMAFAGNSHGFVMGDPINGKFLLLETKDAGETWAAVADAPAALKDEAAFAASGTCMRADGVLTIVTGGSNSRMLISPLSGFKWAATALLLTNGGPSRGAFSFAKGKSQTVIVGGNYAKDTVADSVAYLLPLKKSAFKKNFPVVGPAGYQSCVEYLSAETYLSTGTPGSNITTDGGKTWRKIDSKSYNVCRKAKNGTLVLLAGEGKTGILNP
jgi:photosystem II stability/assembly factor-like uncharacterized protein